MTHAFKHEPRVPLTDIERAKLFLEKDGRCHRCTRKIMLGETWYDEHVHSLGTGGTNKWGNRDVTCKNCFPIKNAEDATKVAKQRAVAVSLYVPTDQRQKRGRPMAGTKRSGWKHKVNGDWERRS